MPRTVICTHCGRELEVSDRAFSVNCRYCNQRVGVEDHVIQTYHSVTNIETGGSISVTPTGHVRAKLRVQNLEVAGQMYGDIVARGKVTVYPGARMVGDVSASRLEVKEGALLKGYYRIEPIPGTSEK